MAGFPEFESWWSAKKPSRSWVRDFDRWYSNNRPTTTSREEQLATDLAKAQTDLINAQKSIQFLQSGLTQRDTQIKALESQVSALQAEITQLKAQLAECQEPTPDPEPEPSGNWPAFPEASHFGSVINEDINAPATPGPWLRQSTPHIDGASANDPFLIRRAESGLWTPHGKTSPLTHSREHVTPTAPPQSVYDRMPGETYTENASQQEKEAASTRCQLQRWSDSSAFWVGKEGDRVFFSFGFQIMPNPPITKLIGGGQPGYTQLVQWKARSSSYSEVDSIVVGRDGIQFEFSSHPNNEETRVPIRDVPHGLWHRIVVETVVSVQGKHALWVQPNGKPWRKVGEWNVGTIPSTSAYRNVGKGPYHRIVATTNNRPYWARYAGAQIINYKP